MHSRKSFSFLAGECHASLEIILEFYSKLKKKKHLAEILDSFRLFKIHMTSLLDLHYK
jgi:hypothetical protein